MAKKVLIVDDSVFMQMTLKDILVRAGYEVAGEAEGSEDAVRKYTSLKPDLVTMDIVILGEGGSPRSGRSLPTIRGRGCSWSAPWGSRRSSSRRSKPAQRGL